MTLFASLGSTGSTSPSSSSCSPPTAIQLHSRAAFDFVEGTVALRSPAASPSDAAPSGGESRGHSILTYQAVQTQRDDEEKRSHDKPDLGIWNLSVDNGFDAASLGGILRSAVLGGRRDEGGEEEKKDGDEAEGGESPPNSVLMTIHLNRLNEVQPALERMRSVLISAYEHAPLEGGGSTALKSLRDSAFGNARIKRDPAPPPSGSEIRLILAAIVPHSKEEGEASAEYRRKQSRNLVVYHLHKWAAEVDCTLAFAREGEDAVDGFETIAPEELAALVRRVAAGLPPPEPQQQRRNDEEGKEGETTPPNQTPAVHPPGSHDVELLRGAMLRNASCEGMWDAAEDDLVAALPPPSKPTSAAPARSRGGDEEWLSKLASSVGITVDTSKNNDAKNSEKESPTPVQKSSRETMKKKKSVKVSSSKEGSSEKDPSDFFANLLKK